MFHIIIADENKNFRKKIKNAFIQEGFIVDQAASVEEVLGILDKNYVDLIITNSRLSGYRPEGLIEVFREMHSEILITMLDEKMNHADLKAAFLAGADDYLRWEVDEEELYLRSIALLKRTGRDYKEKLVIGKVVLDINTLTVSREDEIQTLPKKEFYLLYKLLAHPEKIHTRDQLMDEIWGVTSETTQSTLNVHINRLRKKFDQYPEFKIKAIRGIGYKAKID